MKSGIRDKFAVVAVCKVSPAVRLYDLPFVVGVGVGVGGAALYTIGLVFNEKSCKMRKTKAWTGTRLGRVTVPPTGIARPA